MMLAKSIHVTFSAGSRRCVTIVTGRVKSCSIQRQSLKKRLMLQTETPAAVETTSIKYVRISRV
jgi:hypothetical protein